MTLVYFSRGAITYSEILEMTPFEKDILNEFETDHIKQELKKMYPNY